MKYLKNKKIAMFVALMLAAANAAGCGAGPAEDKQGQAATESDSDKQTSSDASEKDGEEKTEVRREDYPDCDGSGHGYVEIYYSDGSMETEEY